MLRRLIAALIPAPLPGRRLAVSGTKTETNNVHGLVETFVDVVASCDVGGPRYEITTTSNAVEHVTKLDDGRLHATFTQTGRFVAVL